MQSRIHKLVIALFYIFAVSCATPLAKKEASFEDASLEKETSVILSKLKENPRNSHLHLKLARVYLEDNNIPLAIKELHKTVKLDSQNAEAYFLLCKVLLKCGKTTYGELLKYTEKLASLNFHSFKLHFLKGEVHLRYKKLKKALEEFKESLKYASNDEQKSEVYLRLIFIYRELEDFKNADKIYTQAKILNPNIDEVLKKMEIERKTSYDYSPELFKYHRSGGDHPLIEDRITKVKKKMQELENEESD
ncbi:hypothetical protein DRO49_06020 [Candidatus Bathyarchaeota archaeon]|nr:MAG: hypothetical protein DRO49_06020 [Candidatus Bathyarchaeota archaeon]